MIIYDCAHSIYIMLAFVKTGSSILAHTHHMQCVLHYCTGGPTAYNCCDLYSRSNTSLMDSATLLSPVYVLKLLSCKGSTHPHTRE